MNRPLFRLVLPLAVVLAAGAVFARWLVERADREMRADLIQQAQVLAQGMNVEYLAGLSGTADDAQQPAYQRLKQQLITVRSEYPGCRFIYLTGRRAGGSIVFLSDSEPEGSKEISPPGQVYAEASRRFRQVFDDKTPMAEGPLPDRWGVWVSALVPVIDPQLGTLAAVLGMDVDARDWNWTLARAARPAILLTLALAAILVLGWMLIERRSARGISAAAWMRRIEPGLVVAAGLALSLGAAWLAYTNVSRRRDATFAKLAGSQTTAMVEKLQAIRDNQLESLAHFYAARDQISAGEFEEFALSLTKNQTVTTWGWIPAVSAAERAGFEAAARAQGLGEFEIWEFDAAGRRVRAGDRDLYYPVFQVAPPARSDRVVGRESGAEPLRRAALETAVRTGLATGTEPVTLASEAGDQKGIVVYRPVFARDNSGRLRGFVGASVQMESLLQTSLVLGRMPLMELSLLHPGAPAETLAATWKGARPRETGPKATRPLFAFGKVFVVTTHPGPEFALESPLRAGGWALIFGLVLTGTVSTITRLTLRQRSRLERLVTERTTELQQSEESYRNQFANNSVAMLLIDPADGSLLDANAAAAAYYGYSGERMRSMRILDVTLRSRDDTRQLAAAIAQGQRTRFESQHRLADGTVRDVAVAASSIQYGGRPILHVILQDITEQKKAAMALESAHATLQERIKELTCLYAISRLTAESRRSVDELLAAAVDVIPSGWQYPAIARARITHQGRVHASADFKTTPWLQSADILIAGETIGSVEVCYLEEPAGHGDRPFLAEERNLLATIATQFGVTIERRRAEGKLRQLSGVIEQAPLSVLITNLAGVIEYVNPKFCAVTGYTKEEVIGQPVTALATRELQPAAYDEMRQAIHASQVWTGEMRARKKNGEVYLENVVVAPLVDDHGQTTHFVSLKDDITAQKRSEAELARERELSGLKSQFISVASHEFRTPLAAAVGSLELLERHAAKLTEAKRVELITRIQRSLSRLTIIMDDVLQLSRADSGRVKVTRMTVDLSRFVQDIIQEVATGDRQQHAFAFEQTGGPQVVPADTKLLHHIISNLAGNAVRYSPAGTRVSVRLELGEKEFALTVADEGIGVPEAERDRVFEPFVRGSNVGQIGGTGLGLNIVKRYAEIMGGRIELLPTTRGAAFRITIPLQQPTG